MSIGPTILGIRLFHNLTLKVQGLDHSIQTSLSRSWRKQFAGLSVGTPPGDVVIVFSCENQRSIVFVHRNVISTDGCTQSVSQSCDSLNLKLETYQGWKLRLRNILTWCKRESPFLKCHLNINQRGSRSCTIDTALHQLFIGCMCGISISYQIGSVGRVHGYNLVVSTPDYHRALSLWVNEPTRKNIACLIKHNLSNGCSMIRYTVMNIVVTVGSAWW